MFRTVFLGLMVNIGIMLTLSFILRVTGLDQYLLQQFGTGYPTLMIFCLFWGMGGAFISLMISKWIAKTFQKVQILSPTGQYGALVQKVHQMARNAGITKMPEVGIYDSPDVNAFATGPSKNNSLVAVSTGLLQNMSEDEVDGVLAHEVTHIANGDMITMTVIQGIVNAFVMFLAMIVTQIIDQATRDSEGRGGLGFFARWIVRDLLMALFGFMAYPIVAWFSRWREYRADAGSAALVGNSKMIAALEKLKIAYPQMAKAKVETNAMNISSKGSFAEWFSTHPSLDKRIAALR